MNLKFVITLVISSVVVLILAACGSDKNEENGSLSIGITDGPVDNASEVVVVFNAIEIKPSQGAPHTIDFEQSKSIDLLALQNGDSEPLLQNESLEAGNYSWMRLLVSATEGQMDSYITLEDGSTHSLYVPSGLETGLKINRSFTIAEGQSVNFMIDFDLRKSVLEPNNQSQDYKLKPVLRVTDLTQVGSIAGYIDGQLVSDEVCNEGLAVYAYSGSDIIADDEGSNTPPLVTTIPEYDAANDRFDYSLSFLLSGEYTVAVTCDADNDSPETDEIDWGVIAVRNASVSVDSITEINF